MSTAFFHGFDEEYAGGLDLSSDVFEQLFIDALARRARGHTDNGPGDDGVTSSTGLDELTTSSLGEIDNHALLADNIGVDIVGRSNGPEVDRRPTVPTSNYLPPPGAIENGRNTSPGELQSKSLYSFLGMASSSSMIMGGGMPTLGHVPLGMQCPAPPQQQQQQQQQQPPTHAYPMNLHRPFCPEPQHLAGVAPAASALHYQYPPVISSAQVPTPPSFSQQSTNYTHTFQNNPSAAPMMYGAPAVAAPGSAPVRSSMTPTGSQHAAAARSKNYHSPAATAMLSGMASTGGGGAGGAGTAHDYLRPASSSLPNSPRPLVGRVSSRAPATVSSFSPLPLGAEHRQHPHAAGGAVMMASLNSPPDYMSPLQQQQQQQQQQQATPTTAVGRGASSSSSVRLSPGAAGSSVTPPNTLRLMGARSAAAKPPTSLIMSVPRPLAATPPVAGGFATTPPAPALPPLCPAPMRPILVQDPGQAIKRKRKRVRKPTLSAASPTDSSGTAVTSPKSAKGGWPKGKPRTRRESGEPRPVLSSWQFFISAQYKTMDRGKETQLTKNMKQLAAKWQSLPDVEKKVYEEKAAGDKKRYLTELKEFQSTESYADVLTEKVKEHFGSNSATDTIDANVVDALKTSPEVENSKDLYCSLCQQLFTTQHNHHEHLLGKKHMQNVRKNISAKAMQPLQPVQPCCATELSLGHKADIYVENFFDDNRLRDLEIQELKTRQIVAQMRLKRHQDTISSLEAQKALLQHRYTGLNEHSGTVQSQFDGLYTSLRLFFDWEPAAKRRTPLHGRAATLPLAGGGVPLVFPASPSTPLSQALPGRDVTMQLGSGVGGCVTSLPSTPDSASSTCSVSSMHAEVSVVGGGGGGGALRNPVCTAGPPTGYGGGGACVTAGVAGLPSPQQRCAVSAAPPPAMEWMEIPPGSHRITGSTVLSPLRKASPAAHVPHAAAQWRVAQSSSSSMLSNSIMHLTGGASSSDPGVRHVASSANSAVGSAADPMLAHAAHAVHAGLAGHGGTPGLSASNMLSWNDWLAAADLNVSACP